MGQCSGVTCDCLFQHTRLLMGDVGSLIANAHVRALAVVDRV